VWPSSLEGLKADTALIACFAASTNPSWSSLGIDGLLPSERTTPGFNRRYIVRSKFILPVRRAFPGDAPANHAERSRVFHALAGYRQIGAINQVAVLVAEHLITTAFLHVVLNNRVTFVSGALAIGYDCVTTAVFVSEFADVPGEILMGLAGTHRPNLITPTNLRDRPQLRRRAV
jgi:hypothetical protein